MKSMATPRNEALEAAILREPDTAAPYLVYADWLQSQGSWLGELIAVQAQAEKESTREVLSRASELLLAHRDELFGPLANEDTGDYPITFVPEWRYGFITSATFKGLGSPDESSIYRMYEALMKLPSARFLRALS